GRLARAGPFEERVEVGAAVAAVAAGCVEGRDAAEVGPLADRALGHAEVFRGLPEREPFRLSRGRAPRAGARLSVRHLPANLSEVVASYTRSGTDVETLQSVVRKRLPWGDGADEDVAARLGIEGLECRHADPRVLRLRPAGAEEVRAAD